MSKSASIVDVIIPTYNGLPWLKATIGSVLSQTYKNFKLYVVDDGSTDDTEEFVRSLKDRRIVYIKKGNGGQSTARNLGIRSSDSPFIAFLDADDLWLPEKLEKQLKVFDSNPRVGLVYGHHYIIDEEDVVLGNLRIWKRGNIADDLAGGNLIAGSASMVLIKREVLEEAGAYFHEDFVNGEDWELWLRIALISEIDFVPEIIASVRQHGTSTQTNVKKMADGLLYAYEVMSHELSLSDRQKRSLSSYCINFAGSSYLSLGLRGLARRTFLRLIKENPEAFLAPTNWKPHLRFGPYAKAILGNPLFDLFILLWAKLTKFIKKSLTYTFHLSRSMRRKVTKAK